MSRHARNAGLRFIRWMSLRISSGGLA